MSGAWWKTFFDADYLRIWSQRMPDSRTTEEVDFLWRVLHLRAGDRVLDAPCGYGRIARPLAERGAQVLGVDQSQDLLDHAERTRGAVAEDRLRYLRQDLRERLAESGFDVALNLFSSMGYGTEEDDLAVLQTLTGSVRRGGTVVIETAHRDTLVALWAREGKIADRLSDGTLVIEEPGFDAVSGRAETTWYWQGPNGSGQKAASARIYTITELVRLMERAGLRFREALQSRTGVPFEAKGPLIGGRVTLLADRP